MSDYTEYQMQYYKITWEESLSKKNDEIKMLQEKLDKAKEALKIISKEETDSVLPVNLYIAPTAVKRNYMDEAYRLIAREALKEIE